MLCVSATTFAETDSNIIYGCLSNVLRNIVYKVALLERRLKMNELTDVGWWAGIW